MHIVEAERQVPIEKEYDLIVCGGGPAGVSAAISAGRLGLRTLLIENYGVLGGIWTSGLLSVVLDAKGKKGLLLEMLEHLTQLQGRAPRERGTGYIFDPEAAKILLDDLCQQAGVDVLLYTRVVDARREGRRLTSVITESVSGRQAFAGRLFVDCTGNGDLAAFADCGFDVGHPQTGQVQPATLLAIVSGMPSDAVPTRGGAEKDEFRRLLESLGLHPSYQKPTLSRLPGDDLWYLGVNHEFNVRHDSAADMTQASMRARKEVFETVRRLRTLPGWEKIHVVATSTHLGIREGRRIKGLYTVSTQDIIDGKKWDDGICLVKFSVDLHDLEFKKGDGVAKTGVRMKPYHIPFRSLVSRDVDNLAMAGRCISGEFIPHSSYRVTGNVVPMGEAAGIAAKMAGELGFDFSQVDGVQVAKAMRENGHEL